MKNILTLIIISLLTGCMSSFHKKSYILIQPNSLDDKKFISIINEIKSEYQLELDKEKSNTEGMLSFYGTPYHRYSYELKNEESGNQLVIVSHEAYVSSRKKGKGKPRLKFIELLINELGSKIIEIKDE